MNITITNNGPSGVEATGDAAFNALGSYAQIEFLTDAMTAIQSMLTDIEHNNYLNDEDPADQPATG